jgi:hypothetical protein
MSITFWAPDAPRYKVKPYPEEEPDYEEERSELPEINLSNSNASAILRALGVTLEPDYCGTWEVEQLPEILARAMKLANIEELRSPAVSETVQSGGELRRGESDGNVVSLTAGCRMISFGRSDEYVRQTALRLVELLRIAKEQSFSVTWG